MRDNNIISILDVVLMETTLVTKSNHGPVESGTATVAVPDSVESWTGRNWDHHSGTVLSEFDLSTSSDSSVSLSSAFRVSVLLCFTQEKTRSQCALLWGMVTMPSIMLARAWNGFTRPPFFLSLGAFHDRFNKQGLTSFRPEPSRRHVNKEAYGLSSVRLKL